MKSHKRINWAKFGKDIHAMRLDANLGQREVARDLGVPSATMCRAENGKAVDADTYLVLCEWLGKDAYHFLVKRTLS